MEFFGDTIFISFGSRELFSDFRFHSIIKSVHSFTFSQPSRISKSILGFWRTIITSDRCAHLIRMWPINLSDRIVNYILPKFARNAKFHFRKKNTSKRNLKNFKQINNKLKQLVCIQQIESFALKITPVDYWVSIYSTMWKWRNTKKPQSQNHKFSIS